MTQATKDKLQQYLLILVVLFAACLCIWAVYYLDSKVKFAPVIEQVSAETPIEGEKTPPEAISEALDPCTLPYVECQQETMWRTVTAYNTVVEQCDSTPCISANGTDICQGMSEGKKYVATNELAFGTKVRINGEVYEVVDRTNSRYQYRYDIAFPADKIKEAKQFGVKTLKIEVL